MENEREPKFTIQISDKVSPGEFVLVVGKERIMGTITDLGDSWVAGGMARSELEKLKDVQLVVNPVDWETSKNLIWTGEIK